MKIQVTAACRIGCVRHNNEDMVLVGPHFVRDDEVRLDEVRLDDKDRYLIAVADGMGGHRCGEVASSAVLESLHYFFNDMPSGMTTAEFNEKIVEWLAAINFKINSRGKSIEKYKDMGTTLVAFVYYNDHYFWMNCGDSRLYRLRDNRLVQLTHDHSLRALTGDDSHPNVITNCVGGGCKHSFIDIMEIPEGVLDGDRYLLCSDGLNDMLTDEKIEKLLLGGSTANGLCNAAILAGGIDNVSTCIIDMMK